MTLSTHESELEHSEPNGLRPQNGPRVPQDGPELLAPRTPRPREAAPCTSGGTCDH